MNYPNLPNSALEITKQPEVKEITNELLKQLQSALNSNSLFTEQVELSLKGIVRILEVLLSLDFFKNANEIDSSLRNSIEWLSNAGESLKNKMKEYEGFFSEFNTSMKANEQEVTAILNANTENIKSEIKKLENQLIETTTRLLTSYQIFLNQAKENATTQINADKTQAITNITEAKESATTQINADKTQAINNITQEKQQATIEITEAKKTAFNELLETLKPKFSGLFAGVYYIHNVIYIQGGWEQKVKDLSDYTLEKSKKYEIEVFFQFVNVKIVEKDPVFGLKTNEGFLKESIQKITHKYGSQIYYKKLLVESVSGVLALYHGYFYGNINYFNEAIVTIISTKRALKGL
ncbi:ATP synthase F0 subunit B [Helicobacter pylori]|uniref:ATP synthase F0 subunit B n=1 Tax=Helicobacter pylori TaxID=210 RepID=UPI0013FCF9D8